MTNANALIKEVDVALMSYHTNPNGTYKNAPNKIDSNAQFVLNPGVILGFDTRKESKMEGLSFVAKGGFLQDCANKTLYLAGGGGRYRKMISSAMSFDINGYIMGANAVTNFGSGNICEVTPSGGRNCYSVPSNDQRAFAILPFVNFGLNYHFPSGKTIGGTLAIVPPNTAIAATSGSPLLFFTLNFGF